MNGIFFSMWPLNASITWINVKKNRTGLSEASKRTGWSHYSSSWVSDWVSPLLKQAAGVSIVNTYSHRFGSDTDVIRVSVPQSKSTLTERWGPFQQAAPFANSIAEYLSGLPSHRSHVPSLKEGEECVLKFMVRS